MIENALIPASENSAWMKALNSCGNYDIYHLPQYHLLAEEMGEGQGFLLFYRYKGAYAGLPFLLRSVERVEGLEGSQFNDVSSVYGYPGVVTSLDDRQKISAEFRIKFQMELLRVFRELSVVSFFSRTNPLLPNTWMLDGFCEILHLSKTVAVDLSSSDVEQLGYMTKGHRYDIRKAHRNGLVVEEDDSFQYLDDFIEIYNQTMRRNSASDHYYFSKTYYLQLKKKFGKAIRLFFAKFQEKPISASMFFFEKDIIQYHLSGSLHEFFSLNGAKLILDEVRQLGMREGFSWLHLGGGVGSSEDNLFRFKAGFSKIRLPFHVVRHIVDQKGYEELCLKRQIWAQNNNCVLSTNDFFPDYRKPTNKFL